MEKMVEVEPATQDELRQDLKSLFQGAIRLTLEMVLEEELKAMVGARRFERVGSRKGHRNGTYLRRLLTSLGQIDVTVPRSREGGSPADVMGRYQRRSEEVDAMMVEAYVSGVSQRKMGDVTEALMGERVGRSTVSRVAKRLDEGVQTLRSAPIEGAHPYLYLDATFLDARWARKVENVSALVAYAVGPDGHRRLLGITLGPEESENSWSELLEQLLERGLSGVQLVIADEHAGLAAAVRRFLPEVRRQRCTVHLQRNVLAKVPHRLRKRVAREVAAVFRAPGLAESKKRLAKITARWHKELPEAVNVLERGFTAATQFYAFPEPHWARLRTTNSLERLHTEIKRRIRSAGAFPDRASALRLITAVCSKDYCGLERTSLPGSHASRTEGGRQGSLTEASRSFLSLLHTTRDLTAPEASSGGLDTGQADPGGSGQGKLLSPERRRRCVVRVRQQLGASERRACRVLGQPRTTQRRARKVASDEGALRGDIVRLASRFGRYGYRRVTDMLRIEGWGVNHKRVERIWRQEGLKVPERQPKRGRLWLNDGSCIRLRPLYRGHVWSYDFVASRTHDGRALKLLTVLDDLFVRHGPPGLPREPGCGFFLRSPARPSTA